MDAHFDEYLAAVVGMQDLYGHPADDQPSEFHGPVDPTTRCCSGPTGQNPGFSSPKREVKPRACSPARGLGTTA